MDPELKEAINTKLAEALEEGVSEQEFQALQRKVAAIADLFKLIGE